MNGPLSRVEIIVKGQVQGVFYRVSARDVANSLSLKGWAKNSLDSSVHICVEGPLHVINEFVVWCKKGPSHARVSEVNVTLTEYKKEFTSFEIRYS